MEIIYLIWYLMLKIRGKNVLKKVKIVAKFDKIEILR